MHVEKGGGRNGWLLGDRGCGIQPYLMTPFRPDNVSTASQAKYQKAHTKTRNTILFRGLLACGKQDTGV